MEQEYPFRPRGRHGFDREDVINYISQAQQRCNEHLARMEELEAAKNAWYTQAKSMEREKAALVARNRELEEQMERGASGSGGADSWFGSDPLLSAAFPQEQELAALKARSLELEKSLAAQRESAAAKEQELQALRTESQALRGETQLLQEEARRLKEEAQTLRGTNAAMRRELDEREAQEAEALPQYTLQSQELSALRTQNEQQTASLQELRGRIAAAEQEKQLVETERAGLANRVAALENENAAIERAKNALAEQTTKAEAEAAELARKTAELQAIKGSYEERIPGLTEQIRQLEALRSEYHALSDKAAQLEIERAALADERTRLTGRLSSCEAEKAALESTKAEYEETLPALQEQLAQLSECAEQISSLSNANAALGEQLEAARELERSLEAHNAQLAEQVEKLQQQLDVLARKNAELTQKEAQARQDTSRVQADSEQMRARLNELEGISAQQTGETLRSMVLASFNYSDLYVDNNLKTAQFISDTTSHNISRVSDSAGTLLEQLDSISRSFSDTTDTIRRNLANFQRELSTIQNGMNRRLSKGRFSALLEENERLRKKMEQELLEELDAEDEEPLDRPMEQTPTPLPFAEDLPSSYHSYLDD